MKYTSSNLINEMERVKLSFRRKFDSKRHRNSFLDSYCKHDCRLIIEEDIAYNDLRHKGIPLLLVRWWHEQFFLSYNNKTARKFYLTRFAMRKDRLSQSRHYSLMIHPWSIFRTYWNYVITCCAVLNTLSFALTSSVVYGWDTQNLKYVNIFCESMLLLDILINFRTGHIDKTQKYVVLDRRKIFTHYISTVLFIHVFSAIPLQMIASLVDEGRHLKQMKITSSLFMCVLRIINAFRLIRIFELTKCWKLLHTKTSSSFPWNWKLVHTLFLVLITMNQVTDFGDTLTLIEAHLKKHLHRDSFLAYMLVQKHHVKRSWTQLYSMDLSRVCNAFQTSSQGLLYNYRPLDRIVILINYFLGACFFVWCVLEAATYFYCKNYKVNESTVAYKRIICMIRSRQLPDVMEHRIAEYFRYFHVNKLLPPRSNEMYTSLPRALKNEISIVSRRHLLTSIPYFADWPASVLDQIALALKKAIYLRGDTIIEARSTEECFRIIEAGVLAEYSAQGEELQHIVDGAYFGEVSLFSDEEMRTTRVVAVTNCCLYELYKPAFAMVMRNHIILYVNLKRKLSEQLNEDPKLALSDHSASTN